MTQTQNLPADPNSLQGFAERLIATGFVVSEKGKDARKPTINEALMVAHAASKYGLDPLMGEVSVLGAKLYTNLSGVRKSARDIARKQGMRYLERTRPATEDECKAAHVDASEHYWVCDIVIDGEESFRGHGFASTQNVGIAAMFRNGQMVGFDQRVIRNMAENRACRRALVACFGLPFSDEEEKQAFEAAPAAGLTVSPVTGLTSIYPALPDRPAVVYDLPPRPEAEAPKPPAAQAAPAARRQAAARAPRAKAEAGLEEGDTRPVPPHPADDPGDAPWSAAPSPIEQAEIMRREREEAEQEAAARDRQRGENNYQANQGLSTRG